MVKKSGKLVLMQIEKRSIGECNKMSASLIRANMVSGYPDKIADNLRGKLPVTIETNRWLNTIARKVFP